MGQYIQPAVFMLPFSGRRHDRAALSYGIKLAHHFKAQMDIFHILPDPQSLIVPYPAYDGLPAYPESAFEEMARQNEEYQAAAEQDIREFAKKEDFSDLSFYTTTDNMTEVMALSGRLRDLVVISRGGQNDHFTDIINSALLDSARPVLLVPPAPDDAQMMGGISLVAWDGSLEAARALYFALPYLQDSAVKILTVPENASGKIFPEPAAIHRYLQRHGLGADILTVTEEDLSMPEAILDMAHQVAADRIVMGAWGHSRLRETIWGGATSHMIHNADIATFMAH